MSLCMEFEQVNSKRVYGLCLGLRHSAMTRISGKSFSPQYQKLLNGPLNLIEKLNWQLYEFELLSSYKP